MHTELAAARLTPKDCEAARRTAVIPRALVGAITLIVLALLILTADRGLDLTDESFYLAWIASPERFPASITPFGLPLHLLFEALGSSLIALRVAGAILLFLSGLALGSAVARYYALRAVHLDHATYALLGGLAGLSYFVNWIQTPSYNMLGNVGGALIMAGGLGWANADLRGTGQGRLAASLLVAAGGFFAFFGKPPLAAMGALFILVMVVRSARREGSSRPLLFLPVMAAASVVAALLTIGAAIGLKPFLASLEEGLSTLNFGNGILQMPVKTLREMLGSPPLVVSLVLLGLVLSGVTRRLPNPARRGVRLALGAAAIIVVAYALAVLVYGAYRALAPWNVVGLPFLSIAVVVFTLGMLCSDQPKPAASLYLPFLLLLALPFATAMGTGNNTVLQTGATVYPLLLAIPVGIALTLPGQAARGAPLLSVVLAVFALTWSAAKPYGMERHIFAQTEPLSLPFTDDEVKVATETAVYAFGLRQIATTEGLTPRTQIVDLSEGGPGTAMLLNGQAPYYPWLLPGTRPPGAIGLRAWELMTPAQKQEAWLVGPFRPEYQPLAKSILTARPGCYRRYTGLRHFFWQETRAIELWVPLKPCRPAPRQTQIVNPAGTRRCLAEKGGGRQGQSGQQRRC